MDFIISVVLCVALVFDGVMIAISLMRDDK